MKNLLVQSFSTGQSASWLDYHLFCWSHCNGHYIKYMKKLEYWKFFIRTGPGMMGRIADGPGPARDQDTPRKRPAGCFLLRQPEILRPVDVRGHHRSRSWEYNSEERDGLPFNRFTVYLTSSLWNVSYAQSLSSHFRRKIQLNHFNGAKLTIPTLFCNHSGQSSALQPITPLAFNVKFIAEDEISTGKNDRLTKWK